MSKAEHYRSQEAEFRNKAEQAQITDSLTTGKADLSAQIWSSIQKDFCCKPLAELPSVKGESINKSDLMIAKGESIHENMVKTQSVNNSKDFTITTENMLKKNLQV